MSKSIPKISVKIKTVQAALIQLRDAIDGAVHTLEMHQPQLKIVQPANMDEIRVRHWLRGQEGFVTAAHVATALFGNSPASKSLSMSVAKYLKAAGWRVSKRVQGTQYWARGASAERVS
jgi:hypothetical protein